MNKTQIANAGLLFMGGQDQPKVQRKYYKPKELIVSPIVAQYMIDRDNDMLGDVLVCEETKIEILKRK